MEDNEFLIIRVKVGAMVYPIRVRRTEEPMVRKAAIRVNKMLEAYKAKFPSDNIRPLHAVDYLSFAALQLALDGMAQGDRNGEIVMEMESLSEKIGRVLEENTRENRTTGKD